MKTKPYTEYAATVKGIALLAADRRRQHTADSKNERYLDSDREHHRGYANAMGEILLLLTGKRDIADQVKSIRDM
jgi:hypothetical protein